MKRILILLLCFTALYSQAQYGPIITLLKRKGSGGTSAPAPQPKKQALVYLLEGQSNMQGVDLVSNLPSDNPLQFVQTGVYIWNHQNASIKAWEPYSAGNNQQFNLTASTTAKQYGPEGAFGYFLNQYLGVPIYIIKLGYGGSTLGNTGGSKMPDGVTNAVWNKPTGVLWPIYWNEYVYPALQALQAQGLQPVIKGVFRYQGENDANGEYVNFQTNLETFYADHKAALGLTNLHWLETRLRVNLPTSGTFSYNSAGAQAVRDAQAGFVNANASMRQLLTVDDCTVNADGVHIGGGLTGQWLVGQKAADIARYW